MPRKRPHRACRHRQIARLDKAGDAFALQSLLLQLRLLEHAETHLAKIKGR